MFMAGSSPILNKSTCTGDDLKASYTVWDFLTLTAAERTPRVMLTDKTDNTILLCKAHTVRDTLGFVVKVVKQ